MTMTKDTNQGHEQIVTLTAFKRPQLSVLILEITLIPFYTIYSDTANRSYHKLRYLIVVYVLLQ